MMTFLHLQFLLRLEIVDPGPGVRLPAYNEPSGVTVDGYTGDVMVEDDLFEELAGLSAIEEVGGFTSCNT